MNLYTFNVTDLTEFDSPSWEEWLRAEDLPGIGEKRAKAVAASLPILKQKGMCIAIYDEDGIAVKLVPIDPVQ